MSVAPDVAFDSFDAMLGLLYSVTTLWLDVMPTMGKAPCM